MIKTLLEILTILETSQTAEANGVFIFIFNEISFNFRDGTTLEIVVMLSKKIFQINKQ
jgi:hypothetical protein